MKITGWKNLDNKDVQVVAANPKTLGGPVGILSPSGGQSPGLAALILRHVALSPESTRM